MYIVPIILVRF